MALGKQLVSGSEVAEVVVGSEQSHQDAPQKIDCLAIFCRISVVQRFWRPALARTVRSASDGNA